MNIEQVPIAPVQPEVTEQLPVVEVAKSNEIKQAFSIGQEVQVKRTNGAVESGWHVSAYHEASDGVSEARVEVVSEVPEGLLVKRIPQSELLAMQGEQIESTPTINTIAEQAVGGIVEQSAEPATVSVPEVAVSSAEQKLTGYEENMLKFKSLPEDDQIKLWRYRDALLSKKEAQQVGNGQLSTLEGQRAGQTLREMSPEAAALASWYTTI